VSVNKEVNTLSAILRGAVTEGYIEKNPCSGLQKLVESSIKREPVPDLKQYFAVIWDCEDLRNYCLLLFYTGLRCEDAALLTTDNIKEKFGIKYFETVEGKTNKTVSIPIHDALYRNNLIPESGFIFQYKFNRENLVDRLRRKFKGFMLKNNLDASIVPYSLRHSFQDCLEGAGVEEGTIRHLMGKLPKGSLANYSHPNLQRKKIAIDKLPMLDSSIVLQDLIVSEAS